MERTQRLRSQLIRASHMVLRELKTRAVFVAEGLRDPKERIADLRVRVENLRGEAGSRIQTRIDTLRGVLQAEMALLDTLSPLAVLGRGFGIVRLADGSVVRDAGILAVDEGVDVRVASGSFTARVTTISRE